MTTQLLLTIPQPAEALKVGHSKVYELIKHDGLPTMIIGGMTRVPVHLLMVRSNRKDRLLIFVRMSSRSG